jgi:hypothetical protein
VLLPSVSAMEELVQVSDEVDQETERFGPHRGCEALVLEDCFVALDLGDDAVTGQAVSLSARTAAKPSAKCKTKGQG